MGKGNMWNERLTVRALNLSTSADGRWRSIGTVTPAASSDKLSDVAGGGAWLCARDFRNQRVLNGPAERSTNFVSPSANVNAFIRGDAAREGPRRSLVSGTQGRANIKQISVKSVCPTPRSYISVLYGVDASRLSWILTLT